MAKKTLPPAELTRLHRLTDEESELLLDYRFMPTQAQQAIKHIAKSYAEDYVGMLPGNVVSIARPAD